MLRLVALTRFDIEPIAALRRAVWDAAGEVDGPEGWSVSDVDPVVVLGLFRALELRAGFELVAYRFRSDGNGNGVVWAVPAGSRVTDPVLSLADPSLLSPPPRPIGALDDFMEAIAGDGSAWSYLSASLFAREGAELGALWHGVSWGAETILGASPDRDGPHALGDMGFLGGGPWCWSEEPPVDWRPSVELSAGGRAVVEFFTHDPVGSSRICRNTDRFDDRAGMRFDSVSRQIGEGGGGIVSECRPWQMALITQSEGVWRDS